MNMFDSYTGLYFYSAVFQGNMALIALIAVFVVFRLQILVTAQHQKDAEITTFVREYFLQHGGNIPDDVRDLLRNIKSFFTKLEAKLNDPNYHPSYLPYLGTLYKSHALDNMWTDQQRLITEKKLLIAATKWPFLLILIVIIVSLFLLPLAPHCHKEWPCLEVWLIFATAAMNVIALVVNTVFVFKELTK